MTKRKIALMLLGVLAAFAVCFAADDPQMGTWKLNEAKSHFPPGAAKNATVVYEMSGENVKVTVDGVTADGKPSHSVWTGKFDGKDYPVTGDATSDMRSYTRVSERTLSISVKKGGKVTGTGHVTISADGKSRTVTLTMTDASGNKVVSTAVYDRQ